MTQQALPFAGSSAASSASSSSIARGRGRSGPVGRVTLALSRLAAQDLLVAAYLIVLMVAVLLGGGPRRGAAITMMVVDCAAFAACMLIGRSDQPGGRRFAKAQMPIGGDNNLAAGRRVDRTRELEGHRSPLPCPVA